MLNENIRCILVKILYFDEIFILENKMLIKYNVKIIL